MKSRLRLDDWRINVQFVSNISVTADCEAHPEYKLVVIRANPEQLKQLSHYSVVSLAIHEMIHCVLWPLGDWAADLSSRDQAIMEMTRKLEETVVSSLERIFVDMCASSFQEMLTSEGYSPIDMTFDPTEINYLY